MANHGIYFIVIQKDHGWFHSNNAIQTSDVLKRDQLKVFKGSCFFFYGSNPFAGLEVFIMQVLTWLPSAANLLPLRSFSANLRH